MQHTTTTQVAAIANKFVQHARYKLTPREQKLILYMATLIKPEDSDFSLYMVPVGEIEHILKQDATKKHGSFYERLDDLLDSITDKKISFPTEFTVDGVRLRGHINWVAGAVPKINKDGVLCVEFGFSPQMKPFLLGLKEKFTRIKFVEVAKMRSGFSIRIFQMCKAYYGEHARHGRNVIVVGVEELKERLGIGGKYPDFRNFRRKVLDVAREEINEKTSLELEYEYVRRGRRIGEIRIIINERELPPPVGMAKTTQHTRQRGQQQQARIDKLTESQCRAFNVLMEYGLKLPIALNECLPLVKGSELLGYEDIFFAYLLKFFDQKTNRTEPAEKVKALVGWMRNGRFEEPNLYAKLTEQVLAHKKRMSQESLDNRERAKAMTAIAWRRLHEAERRDGGAATGFKRAESRPAPEPRRFDLAAFRRVFPEQYRRIRLERERALRKLANTSDYPTLLSGSIKAYCEQWQREVHPKWTGE